MADQLIEELEKTKKMKKQGLAISVLGIDPGLTGAIVLLEKDKFRFWEMPLKNKIEIDFVAVRRIFQMVDDKVKLHIHVFLERAVSFGMGTKGAFNYGRGFATLEIALIDLDLPYTLVEPGKWTKVMHAGIEADLKPKAKSVIAVERLFPKFAKEIPRNRNGKFHEGIMDALLIGGYGQRCLIPGHSGGLTREDIEDFA